MPIKRRARRREKKEGAQDLERQVCECGGWIMPKGVLLRVGQEDRDKLPTMIEVVVICPTCSKQAVVHVTKAAVA